MYRGSIALFVCGLAAQLSGCMAPPDPAAMRFRLVTVDPGHFHAALVQKSMYPDVDPVVHVYAPAGDDLQEHLKRIAGFNSRTNAPTHWREEVHAGPDFFQKMMAEKAGNVVVLSGNNRLKADYIARAVGAGLNVLADKPMIITPADLPKLEAAFKTAAAKHVLLYDIMTERFEMATLLQRELSRQPALFGVLETGSPTDPAITKVSVHHFSKLVGGAPLKRPEWFFDVRQQGEGIVDVTTHLVDLVQWEAFPEQALKPTDATVLSARRWTTAVTAEQFQKVTGAGAFPDFLKADVRDGVLQAYANGEFVWRLKGVHAKVSVTWNFEAPPGTGDTHFSEMRGTRANLVIRQGAEQKFKPVLYVENRSGAGDAEFESRLTAALATVQARFPGVEFRRDGPAWRVVVPAKYDVGHEAHFTQVTENYLRYLRAGQLPDWEVPNMITKYATIMQAYEMSR